MRKLGTSPLALSPCKACRPISHSSPTNSFGIDHAQSLLNVVMAWQVSLHRTKHRMQPSSASPIRDLANALPMQNSLMLPNTVDGLYIPTNNGFQFQMVQGFVHPQYGARVLVLALPVAHRDFLPACPGTPSRVMSSCLGANIAGAWPGLADPRFDIKPTTAPSGKDAPVLPFELSTKARKFRR